VLHRREKGCVDFLDIVHDAYGIIDLSDGFFMVCFF
jgi:hypothetical protein